MSSLRFETEILISSVSKTSFTCVGFDIIFFPKYLGFSQLVLVHSDSKQNYICFTLAV